jgi:hypothetical protein
MRQGDQRYFLDALAENPDAYPVNSRGVENSLRGSANQLGSLAPESAQKQAGQYAAEAGNLRNAAPSGAMDFDIALKNRQAYDQAAKWEQGVAGDQGLAAVNRDAANGLRGAMRESLDNTSPELGPRWDGIQEDLSYGLSLSGAGEDASMRSAGNIPAPLSLTGLAAAAGGGPLAYAGALAVKTGGRGMMAGAQGAVSRATGAVGDFAQGFGAAGTQGAGQVGAQAFGREQGIANSRGYLLPDAAFQMMQQPGALGTYEPKFWEAYNSPDSNALASLITKLSRTDERFRLQYLPKLQQLTAESF